MKNIKNIQDVVNFQNFLESLKDGKHDTLIESIQTGFNVCFEAAFVEIGPAPANETPIKPGTPGYSWKSADQGTNFIDLIRSKLGKEPPGARLGLKTLGDETLGVTIDSRIGSGKNQLVVVVYYDPSNNESKEYAYNVKANTPKTWGWKK